MKKTAIFGVPRSGTSWLGQIFNSSAHVAYRYQPIFSYSFPETLSESSTKEEITTFHHKLVKTKDDFVCQNKNVSGNSTPKFDKQKITHLVWKEVRYLNVIDNLLDQSEANVIGLVRHPCGVIKSWMKAPKEFEKSWDILKEWRHAEKKNGGSEDFYGYERWLKAAGLFLELQEKYPNRFKIVEYESLLAHPFSVTERLFDFVGLVFEDQTSSFIRESTTTSSDDPYGVLRKGKNGIEWKGELPNDIIREITNDHRYLEVEKHLKSVAVN